MGRIARVVLAALSGILAGIVALLAVATITARPPLFLLAGLLAFCAFYLSGLLLATRKVEPDRRRRVRALLFWGGTAAFLGFFAWTALLPMDDPRLPPASVEGQRFWDLPTGSRLAYVRVSAEGKSAKPPLIFLHGGPGVPDMRGDSEYFGRLSRNGFTVYVYDQAGSGRSSRLEEPRGYTLERDVADLEAIREQIGADRLILIGHSYGGTLAAAYAASHPGRVSKMVLSSPGDASPSAGGASMTFRLDAREKLALYALLLPPRPMLAYALLQVNPKAAHAFAGDAEMDARFDRVYNRTRPALHCEGRPPGPALHGLGFYANQYPQSAASPPHEDFLADLEEQKIPTLIIKGRCDYLSWSSAVEYLEALPEARLLYLDGSGHNAYGDEPERYMDGVRAFLLGRPLLEPVREDYRVPEDYEGPP
ncbi:2-succinyl-6-hydroxy-2, 4-cyclohexadiene-1-carboxylate synthase [Rubrobacter xylanophilus DSM 9941]|uniref:alpha/beta fold hydrolase n=1 Tax=Rubrobacter xylanophilus TaxID=49319 RepID=UPI001C644CAB|nr:alpha/beta fold hydrolase [Rubrobacter xylanophilus]QYJ15540.1 2-succinyl-6-hydroxy-2, 4-cyclohexadiene-1-carboxylate synthase [Rubrobacter xylanophilus DSM 9941]